MASEIQNSETPTVKQEAEMGSEVENSETGTVKQEQDGAQVTVSNKTSQVIKFEKSIEWAGIHPRYPSTIQPGLAASFFHKGYLSYGSKVAVIYSGFNSAGEACGWLLAWIAPISSTHLINKVYVTCGPRAKIDNMPIDDIRKALENSSQSEIAMALSTKTSANASINDQTPSMATVVADFGLLA